MLSFWNENKKKNIFFLIGGLSGSIFISLLISKILKCSGYKTKFWIALFVLVFGIYISLVSFFYITRKLKKCEVQVPETVFWIVLSVVFIVFCIFPQAADVGASVMGVVTPVNFIFLIIIALLLLRVFLLTIRVSKLEYKVNSLVQELAVRKNEEQDQKK